MQDVRVFLRTKPSGKKYKFKSKNVLDYFNLEYSFSRILNNFSQQDVFEYTCKNLVNDFINGYNCTVLAYGQTGSGKTYTIQGDPTNPGLIPRILASLYMGKCRAVYFSFVEIYNENIYDLFEKEPNKQKLNIRDDPNCGVVVDKLIYESPVDYESAMKIYHDGIKNRKTARTKYNIESSRSHSVFTIYLEEKDNIKKACKFSLVDLAGSEKLDTERAGSDVALKESCNINKSLLNLSEVIKKLGGISEHVNFRDSKLTFILKDSLGGNCKLSVVGTVTIENYANTIKTLKFLDNVKQLRNYANPVIGIDCEKEELVREIRQLTNENAMLKSKIFELKNRKTKFKKLNNRNYISEELEEIRSQLADFRALWLATVGDFKTLYSDIYSAKQLDIVAVYEKMLKSQQNILTLPKN